MGKIDSRNKVNIKYKNNKLILILLFISSISHAVYSLYSVYPSPLKIITSGLLWVSFILSINNMFIHIHHYNRFIDKLISLLLLISVLQFLRYFIYGGESSLISTLTNPYYGLCLLTPIIYFSLQSYYTLKLIHMLGLLLIAISTLCLKSNYYILYLSPLLIFSLYLRKYRLKVLFLIILSLIFITKDALIPNQATGDTQRALLIIFVYACITFSIYIFKRKYRHIAMITVFLSVTIPLILVIYTIKTEISPFSYLTELNNEELGTDNRTFLYDEVFTDLKRNDSFLQGFGISNGYYSSYFSNSLHEKRNVNEVTILHFLFRAGLIWTSLYLTIIVYAMIYSIKKSKNNLCLGGSIMLSGYFFSSFIIDTNSINFIHVIIWFLIAICTSSKFNNLSNIEIIKLIK